MHAPYRRVNLSASGWRLDGVAIPSTFTGRLRGLGLRHVRAVLLHAGSAHTFGMRLPIRMVPVGADGRAHRSSLVPPRSVRRFPGAAWILEMPASFVPPPRGARIVVVPSS